MKRLIITADDFGAAPEVNEAVEIAHQRGVLTAASLMVGAPAVAGALEIAQRNPRLGVGLHVVLVEGKPVLPPKEIPDLVNKDGYFRSDMVRSATEMFFLPRVRRQLAAEIGAQFAAFAATGLPLDHADAHKHFHLHPTIAGLVLKTGARYGLKAVRVPLEPRGPLAFESTSNGPSLLNGWAALLRRKAVAAGMLVPDQVFGLRWSGAMTEERLRGIVENLPEGLSEIYLHPASAAGFQGAAPGYRYTDEFFALTSKTVLAAAHAPGLQLGSFADFLGAPGSVNLRAGKGCEGA